MRNFMAASSWPREAGADPHPAVGAAVTPTVAPDAPISTSVLAAPQGCIVATTQKKPAMLSRCNERGPTPPTAGIAATSQLDFRVSDVQKTGNYILAHPAQN